MSPSSTPLDDSYAILSPASQASDTSAHTNIRNRTTRTDSESNPCSPLSPISSITTLRSRQSFSKLPRLKIPNTSKMAASPNTTKRKREVDAQMDTETETYHRPTKKRNDASTQAGSSIEARAFEALKTLSDDLPELLLSLPCLFQTLAEFREERRLLEEHGIGEKNTA